MFTLQEQLNARCAPECDKLIVLAREDITKADQEVMQQWVLNFVRAAQQEMAELVDCFPWKWWGKYQEIDIQNARVEVVDLFHFIISMAQCLGMTSQDVYDAYRAKNEVNHNRQDSGYTEKDKDDCRHIAT
ncbi:MAG: dUTPase [Euryarchaeota archaeon]|nr:dUTPase [Euryarchaeota archaeon]